MTVTTNSLDAKNKTLNVLDWSTGSECSQGGAGAAVCNGKYIQYAIPDNTGCLTILTLDLTAYQQSHDFSALNTWTATAVKSGFPTSMANNFTVKWFISMVALGDYNYVLWIDNNGVYRALRCRPDMLEPLAIATIDMTLMTDDASTLTSNIAAFAMPNTTVENLAGKIGAVVMMTPSGAATQIQPFVLDPAGFVPNGVWTVYTNGYPVILGTDDLSSCAALSAAWIDQGTLQTDPSQPPLPYITLAVVAHSQSGACACVSFGMPLLTSFDAEYRLKTTGSTRNVTATSISGLPSKYLGTTLGSMPDGNLIALFTDEHSAVRMAYLELNSTSSGQTNYGMPGLYSPEWKTATYDPDGASPSMITHNSPCGLFIPLPATVGPSPCQVPDARSSTMTTYDNCPQQKYVQCVMWSDSNHRPTMSIYYWGTLFSIPNYITATANDDYRKTLLVSLVADTLPYPVPTKAVWGPDSPSGMINWLLCTYSYMVGDETAVDVQSNISSGVGVKAAGTAMVAGVGVQSEGSISGGFATLLGSSTLVHQAASYSVTTKGLPQENPSEDAQLSISAQGTIFGTTPPTKLAVDLYAVLLRNGTSITETVASVVHPLLDTAPVALSGTYDSYCYTPGDLSTYTVETINSTMTSLFNGLTTDAQDEFVINGEDFRKLYTEGNYVDNIIQRFGSQCFGMTGDLSYLEFAFSETGMKKGEFQSTSTFTQGGSSYANGSAYAGVGWDIETDAEVGFLGIVSLSAPAVSSEGYVMVGCDFSSTLSQTTTSTSTWGVSLGEYLNPLASGEAYTARMYFLKPSPLWAMELKHFGFGGSTSSDQQSVDCTNSSPIRIFFTVPYMSTALKSRFTPTSAPAS